MNLKQMDECNVSVSSPQSKRKKPEKIMTSYNATDHNITGTSFPKYLMANSTDTNIPLTKLSPFKLAKAISDAANGKLNNVTALPNNFILLDYNNADQSEKLQSTQFLDNINVNITPHKSFNFCKGVIRYKDLHMCTEEEIVAELFNQGCRRITIKKNDQIVETSTYVLTFNKLQLPKTINTGYQLLRVEKYIPPPLRCNNCQRYVILPSVEFQNLLALDAQVNTNLITVHKKQLNVLIAKIVICHLQRHAQNGNKNKKLSN